MLFSRLLKILSDQKKGYLRFNNICAKIYGKKIRRKHLIKVFNYLINGHRGIKARLFKVHTGRRKDTGHMLQQGNFLLDMWKNPQ